MLEPLRVGFTSLATSAPDLLLPTTTLWLQVDIIHQSNDMILAVVRQLS